MTAFQIKSKELRMEQVLPTNTKRVNQCLQLIRDIFHRDLNLYGMTIPDTHEQNSIYLALMEDETVVGTVRLIMPNLKHRFPINEDIGFDLNQFQPNSFCELSRIVLLKLT